MSLQMSQILRVRNVNRHLLSLHVSGLSVRDLSVVASKFESLRFLAVELVDQTSMDFSVFRRFKCLQTLVLDCAERRRNASGSQSMRC